ncbi:MAG TPA: universal stress protein [Stellaceae bacterium]|nr:universal stress protein [Stellaceae bacterium]
MGFKDILVTLAGATASEPGIGFAAELARDHGAHLVGLSILEPLDLSAYFAPGSGFMAVDVIQEIEEKHRATAQAAASKIEAAFRAACSRAGISHEWRLAEGDPAEVGILHAHYADLAITGQIDPGKPPPGGWARLPEQLALASGRPALIVPYAGRFDTVGRRVLLAWSRTRESARALNDSLPILERASHVTVLSINPRRGEESSDLPGADIALHLARHGVKAEAASTVADDIDVGNTLLSRAADLGADLIVMGCYGHSRMRELILGGATREILRHMTVPVLMAH